MSEITDKLYEKAGLLKIPLTGAFELLPLCNLKCKMCYVRKSAEEVAKEGGLMTGEFWVNCAEKAVREGMLYLLLTGGEPLLHPDFCDIYLQILNMGTCISVNTNGTLIDKENADWFGKYKPRRLNITLYAASEAGYQRCCRDASAYEKVIKGIELLKQKRVPIKFNASITPDNIDELEGIISLAKKYETPIEVETYMFPPVRRDNTMIGKNSRLTPDMAGYAMVRADCLMSEPEQFKKHAKMYSHFVPISEIDNYSDNQSCPEKVKCRAGKSSFWIDWQGRMSYCGMHDGETLDLLNLGFAQAWKKAVEDTGKIEYYSYCGACPNKLLCHSCIAMVHNETGTTDGRPEYICRMNESAAQYYREMTK